MKLVFIFLLMLSLTASAQFGPPKIESPTVVLKNITIIDGTGAEPLPNQTLIIKDNVIAAIFETGTGKIPEGSLIMSLNGRYVIPGLIDSHVHLGTFPSSVDSRTSNEELLKKALYSGITSVRDMAGDARALASLARDAKVGDIPSPDIYYSAVLFGESFTSDIRAVTVSGGEVPGQTPWARVVTNETDLRQVIAEAKGSGATAVKIYAALSPDLVQRLTTEAHNQGLQVWAHASIETVAPEEMIAAGVDVVSHFNLLWTSALDNMPGNPMEAIWTGKYNDLPLKELAANTPPLTNLFRQIKENNTILDPTAWIVGDEDMYPKEHRIIACNYVRTAEEMNIPHSTGTDVMIPTKPKIPLLKAIEMKVNICGLTPLQAIRSATLYGAMAIGNEEVHGSVEKGKKANLVVLGSDPTENIENLKDVVLVFKNGRMYDPRSR